MHAHQSLELSPKSERFGLDKVSITIINEGNHVALDKRKEVRKRYILQNKNVVKLSSVAKKVGFELLSEDF